MDIACDLGVLLGNAVLRVDDDQRDVGAAHGGQCAHDAIALDGFLLDGALAADARGVNDVVALSVAHEGRVDGVARGARDVGNHGALLAENPVDEARLAHVRSADDGDLNGVLVLLGGILVLREAADHLIEQVAQAQHVRGGDGKRIAQAQRVEVVHRVAHLLIVDLVDHQNDRLVAAAQHGRHVLIIRRQPRASVGEEEDDVARLDGDLRLTAHLFEQDVVRARLDAAGVDQREFVVQPLAVRVDAVAGDAGGVLHDGDAPSGDLVEEGGFADVRPADHGDKGFSHVFPPFRAGHRAARRRRRGRA